MAAAFATVEDVELLGGRTLTQSETERTEALLPVVSDLLRNEAMIVGRNLDGMIVADETGAYGNVVKLVTVDVTIRALRQETSGEPMSQESQSGLGYTWSGTYAIPGGGIANAIMRNDLKRLGLRRQRIGALDIYGTETEG
ncbi:MAG: hypothetical protein IJ600_03485 [Lachnospiraceae bacterium]|nr:hypothetical protein [Lachnospiraceae bacterium]